MTAALLTSSEEVAGLGERLVREYTDLPAAVVLHTITRAFQRAQSWGCPPQHLVGTVEASARWGLAQRLGTEPGLTDLARPIVPRQFSPWS